MESPKPIKRDRFQYFRAGSDGKPASTFPDPALENRVPGLADPGPFALLRFETARGEQRVAILVPNAAGEIVWEKVNNSPLSADALTVLQEQWDGRNLNGEIVAAGVYAARSLYFAVML